MHPQLVGIVGDFEAARARLLQLVQRGDGDESWSRRPAEGDWSAAECVAHLNLTSEAFLRPLREGLHRAAEIGGGASRRMRRDLIGWLIWKASSPRGRIRTRTSTSFVPTSDAPLARLLVEFERLQREQLVIAHEADGLPIDRVKITSPFDPRGRYTVFSALTILTAHQHRHIAQAERALEGRR